jgi:hypothetical protein
VKLLCLTADGRVTRRVKSNEQPRAEALLAGVSV